MLKEKKAHIPLNVRRSVTSHLKDLKDLKLPNVNEENGTHGSSLREMPGGEVRQWAPAYFRYLMQCLQFWKPRK